MDAIVVTCVKFRLAVVAEGLSVSFKGPRLNFWRICGWRLLLERIEDVLLADAEQALFLLLVLGSVWRRVCDLDIFFLLIFFKISVIKVSSPLVEVRNVGLQLVGCSVRLVAKQHVVVVLGAVRLWSLPLSLLSLLCFGLAAEA